MLTASYALLFLSLLLASGSAVAAYVAVRASERADGTAAELVAALRRLKAVSDQIAAFEARLDRLAGRVYAQTRKPPTNGGKVTSIEQGEIELDDEIAAELALQSAAPPQR